jgi:hypothetical protein
MSVDIRATGTRRDFLAAAAATFAAASLPSTRSKNFQLVYHLLDAYFGQPAPVYTG